MKIIIAIALVLVLSAIGVGVYGMKNNVNTNRVKCFIGANISTFFLLLIAATIVLFSGSTADAAEVAKNAPLADAGVNGLKYLSAALSTGIASIGAGIAVAVSGSAAIGAISENEKLLGKTIIFVGLAEGIAIYGLIISIMILGQ